MLNMLGEQVQRYINNSRCRCYFSTSVVSINPKTNLMDDLYLTQNTNILKCENWPCSCFNKWFVTTGEVSQLLDAGSKGSPRIEARYGWTLSTLKVWRTCTTNTHKHKHKNTHTQPFVVCLSVTCAISCTLLCSTVPLAWQVVVLLMEICYMY